MSWKADINWLKEVFSDPVNSSINDMDQLPDDCLSTLLSFSHEISVCKGDEIQASDTVGRYLYIIHKGAVRAHYFSDGNDITSWFAFEHHFVFISSYMTRVPNFEALEAIEDSELLAIDVSQLSSAYNKNIEMANLGRMLAELGLVYTEELLFDLKFHTAQERYARLLKNQPEVIKRCKLGDVASYLGVTQVTLSRIRSEME
ncbi:MAG: Crp/Fnr family transcriptional regulator [Hyphomicrobiales bacterium]